MTPTQTQLCQLLGPVLETLDPDRQNGRLELEASTDLVEDLALESIQVMDFIADVEDHFDILIEVDRLAAIRTISELGALVDELKQ